jgi:hypothetical protein
LHLPGLKRDRFVNRALGQVFGQWNFVAANGHCGVVCMRPRNTKRR